MLMLWLYVAPFKEEGITQQKLKLNFSSKLFEEFSWGQFFQKHLEIGLLPEFVPTAMLGA